MAYMSYARYHIIKSSRTWDGRPYVYNEGELQVALDFHFIESARDVVEIITKKNPVGWVIIDSQNGKEVE